MRGKGDGKGVRSETRSEGSNKASNKVRIQRQEFKAEHVLHSTLTHPHEVILDALDEGGGGGAGGAGGDVTRLLQQQTLPGHALQLVVHLAVTNHVPLKHTRGKGEAGGVKLNALKPQCPSPSHWLLTLGFPQFIYPKYRPLPHTHTRGR